MNLFLTSKVYPRPYSYMSTFFFSQGRKVIFFFFLVGSCHFPGIMILPSFPPINRRRKHTKIIKTKYCSLFHPLSPRGVKTVTHHQGRKMHLNSFFQGCRGWFGGSLEGTVTPRWVQQESCFWRQMSPVAFSLRYFSTSNDHALHGRLRLSELGEWEWGAVRHWHPVRTRWCLFSHDHLFATP